MVGHNIVKSLNHFVQQESAIEPVHDKRNFEFPEMCESDNECEPRKAALRKWCKSCTFFSPRILHSRADVNWVDKASEPSTPPCKDI